MGCKPGVIKRVGMKTPEFTKNECLYFALPERVEACQSWLKAVEQLRWKQDRVAAAK
jgi:hypothetical protein